MSGLKIQNVVIIDDGYVDQLIYKKILLRTGLVGSVRGFELAEDALEFLREPDRPKIDVIFLDINMPRMDGFEFLETASIEFGDYFSVAVVVMLTTSLSDDDKKRASKFRMVVDYINKPLSEEIVVRVAKILETKQPF